MFQMVDWGASRCALLCCIIFLPVCLVYAMISVPADRSGLLILWVLDAPATRLHRSPQHHYTGAFSFIFSPFSIQGYFVPFGFWQSLFLVSSRPLQNRPRWGCNCNLVFHVGGFGVRVCMFSTFFFSQPTVTTVYIEYIRRGETRRRGLCLGLIGYFCSVPRWLTSGLVGEM
ncbi:hypothetical protein EX30DRAFT_56438 [Ascodesmis nigricans]|uniref:Uncharacterized protein n=1 Tax=Ascodesmis nigricans TaxID=341454 RepID=A0A4S2MUP1_9PEZI|nr:hypothetical protein EX30DRAFT_56438 [Ascodesmis nigricans]